MQKDQGAPPSLSYGEKLRRAISARNGEPLPFVGVYDAFSAAVVGQTEGYDAIFLSGFGFSASFYGLPDIGFITWSDMVSYVQRIRTILPNHHILVDIDDGYCDVDVACHVVSLLEEAGASGVVLEDQRRPKKCGHLDGKQILDVDDYIYKLERVLAIRRKNLFVVARTDSSEKEDIKNRIGRFHAAGPDALLVDGLKGQDMHLVKELSEQYPDKPFVFNQIAGGKSPAMTLEELKEQGVRLVIYSTPCLFAAQKAIREALESLKERSGKLLTPADGPGIVGVNSCNAVLQASMANRDQRAPPPS